MRAYRHVSLIVLGLFTLYTGTLAAPRVIRGPYLQQPTSSSIIIRWRTDSATDSKVYYGPAMDNLSSSATDSRDTTEHTVKLSGLAPYTKYYYAVGSVAGIQRGPESRQYFMTAPVPGTAQPIRLWAIGDFGKGSTEQGKVRDSYVNFTGDTHTDLWLWLGDNAYPDGTDEEFQDKVFDSITGYHHLFQYMPFMPTPGNHDYNSICPIVCSKDPMKHKGPYFDIVNVPTEGEAGGVPSHTELYYSYDYGNVHFISLNSELGSLIPVYDYNGVFTNGYGNLPLMKWLKQDLAATDKPWKIVYFHQPPYCGQDVDSDVFYEVYIHAMRDHFVPVLEQYGVDLVLSGHDHCYQRTYLLNGLYGNSNTTFDSARNIVNGTSGNFDLGEPYIKYLSGPNAGKGAVYVISGNAGAGNPDGPITHPEMYGGDACPTCIGSFVVDINGYRLDAKYLKGNGEIGDQFTILKEVPTGIRNADALQQSLKVYPNPVQTSGYFEFYSEAAGDWQIELRNSLGQASWQLSYTAGNGGIQQVTLPLDGLPAGMYFLELKQDRLRAYTPVVKL